MVVLQFIQFCCVGLLGFCVDAALFSFLIYAGFASVIALAISYPLGSLVNFLLCMKYVFPTDRAFSDITARYAIIALGVFGANQALLPAVLFLFPTLPFIARLSAAGIVGIGQFFLVRTVAFAAHKITSLPRRSGI